ncbi:MAG: hypothetical protein ACI3V1_06310 [Faecousia sp.]
MATVWYDHYAKCPYYRHTDGKIQVTCDGLCDECNLILRYENPEDLMIQVKTFCLDRFRNCEVYQMLKQIYEDDDNG